MNHEIELRHLRYFAAVAEELHFGRAAKRLHLAQPPLSQQIRKLEEILGYPLFVRTSRAVRLTSAGEVFLDRARRTLRTVQEDLEEARSLGRGEAGTLRVGFIGSGMLTALPSMLGEYRRQFPRVNLQLRESYSSLVMRALREEAVDVGFLRDGDAEEGVVVETVFSEPFVAVLPAHHRLARHQTLSPAAMRDEPFVFPPGVAGVQATAKPVSICEEHGFRPRIVQEAPQWLTILRLVGADLGVSIGPACIEQIAGRDVVCRPLCGTSVQSDIELAYRKEDDRAIVRSFATLAREHLKTARRERNDER
jgi:DNA-binding transcriptional LysR family regulator